MSFLLTPKPLLDKLESTDCTSETSASAVAEGLSTCFPKPTYVGNIALFKKNETKTFSKRGAMKILARFAQINLDTSFFSFLSKTPGYHMPDVSRETVV